MYSEHGYSKGNWYIDNYIYTIERHMEPLYYVTQWRIKGVVKSAFTPGGNF